LDYVLNIEPFDRFITGEHWTGVWEIDLVLDRDQLSPSNWICSDSVFVANSILPPKMNPHKHLKQLLFQACDQDIHRIYKNIEPKFDFVFSGSTGSDFYNKRRHCMEVLCRQFSFADFGKNHKPDQYVKFLNQARVQFVQSGTSHLAPDGYLAQRFFECLAIGPMLTNYHPDLEFLGLVENVDYMVFRNEDDMVAKMNFLLKDEEFRNQMRINGRKKALLLHSYDHRLITILNIIREHDASRPPD